MEGSNPFLNLFGGAVPGNVSQLKEQVETRLAAGVENIKTDGPVTAADPFQKLVEEVFLFTLDGPNNKYLYLEDFSDCLKKGQKLDQEILEQALFERLMMPSFPKSPLIEGATEPRIIPYLLNCYKRAKRIVEKGDQNEVVLSLMQLIISDVVTALQQQDIFDCQNFPRQLHDVLCDSSCEYLGAFFRDVAKKFKEDERGTESLCEIFFPVLNMVKDKLKQEGSLARIHSDSWFVVRFFASNQDLAEVLLRHSTPGELKSGREFENTLLGLFLSFSCIPKTDLGPFEFFDKPSSQPPGVHSAIENHIWTALNSLHATVFELFFTLLKSHKELVLQWFGKCLEKNVGRGKLWNSQMQAFTEPTSVSDGFMLNLGAVLLKLTEPVVASNEKLLKIEPKYGAVSTTVSSEAFKRGVHLLGVEKETCFVPKPDDFTYAADDRKFGLSCDLFYLTHKALDLSTRLAHEKLVQLAQELNKLQRAWQELQSMGGTNTQQGMEIQDRMNTRMSVYLSIRAALAEPKFSQNCMKFLIGSAKWACRVGTNSQENWEMVSSLEGLAVGEDLMFVPEFIATNICDFVLFLKRFHAVILEDCKDDLGYIFDFVLIFMGSKQRMKNPHLRAKLAELCESLVPRGEDGSVVSSSFYREKLFKEYRHRKLLVETLVNVFVSIEMTGEGVAFEQKFNYRRPMYVLMEYLWSLEDHRKQFRALADEAEKNLEATNPPLFLRFLNLLMNDAVYLLDEALSYMSQIREQQSERNVGDWPNVPVNQRPQREGMFQHITMLARFHNHLGLATIRTLSMLTSEIKTIFYQPMLVERIASMLNYFLLHLVGPKNREFKVKDFEKYEFKPAEVVSHICSVYVSLGSNPQFCAAVSADGRSYSPQLFEQAGNVLTRIGKYDLFAELNEVSQRVKDASLQQKTDDEIAGLAPDEFLDPIMSTVMLDPVMLPSSKIIVDRSTIARHLLSDQSDPFNRSSLTLDQVIPCLELKATIQSWLEEQRKGR